jgi:ABC-2 type transport system ATP-binding protein
MTHPAVRCVNLTKKYGDLVALDGLNLTVGPGTVFGFLGPNGAGKTTTIKLLTGLSQATVGEAWVDNVPVAHGGGEARRHFGYLPEEPHIYSWMKGREFLTLVGRLAGLDGTELRGRVSDMLEQAGLKDAANRRVGGYSRGMRQRLGLAQALITHPPVVFLDEPTSALDPVGRRDVLALIETLRGETTVFLSTHILADVERVCDEVAVLNHGRLITQAGRQELVERYAAPIFEVEFARDGENALGALAGDLEGESWVERVQIEGELLRIFAADGEQARDALPRWAVGTGRTLLRYELTRPNLEDIFVRLVSG